MRLEAAQAERRWAIVSAHQQGLSLRQIAAATALGPTRIHQLLHAAATEAIPMPLSQLHERDWPVPAVGHAAAAGQEGSGVRTARLAEEVALLWDCLGWLERLEREPAVAVNLRPADDPATEYVPFDRPRVLRVLRRIASELDELARAPTGAPPVEGDAVDPAARHRRRLAEPPPAPPRRSAREERAALREAAGLDPLS